MSRPRDRLPNAGCFLAGVLVLGGCASTPPEIPQTGEPTADATVSRAELPLASDEEFGDARSDALLRLLIAEFAGQRGHLDVAVDQYLQLTRKHADPGLAQRATKIAVFARDEAAALEAARHWVDADPSDPEARQILAAMYIRHGDAESALRHLEHLLNEHRANAGHNLRMIATLLGREEDRKTALAVMEKLVAGREEDPDALVAYAWLAMRADQVDKAREVMTKIVDRAEINASIAMAYLTMLQKQGMVQEAVDWLDRVLAADPGNFGLRLIYGRLLADASRYEEARKQFIMLAEKAPDNVDVVYALGLLNLQANRVDDAEKNFTHLLSTGERRDDAHYYLGQIAESRQQPDAALEHYRAMEGGANYFHAQLRIALVLSAQGRLDDARGHLGSVAAENVAQKKQLVQAEGEILTEHEQFEAAMSVYDAALADSFDSDLLYTRAMLAEKMDRVDILERDLRAIIDREPDNAQALNALGYTLANRTDRYHEAYELISRALELSPDDFYILDSMGWVLYRLGRLEESVPYLQRARAIRNDPEVAAHLGEVLWVMGDKKGARDVWDSALRDRPDDKTLLDVIKRLTP